MRIGINTLFLIPGEVGGSETYLCETLQALAQLATPDALVLFTNRENDPILRRRFGIAPPFEYVPLAFAAHNRLARIVHEQVQLPRAARRARIDVLWSPGYTAPGHAPCPQVVSLLDMQYRRHPEDLTPVARWVTHLLVTRGARRTQGIATLSAFARSEIVRFTGAPAAKISVTPLAAAQEFGHALPVAARQNTVQRLTGGAAPYLLCVANSYPHKNLAALAEALGRLPSRLPQRLVLVGKPRRGEPALRKALAALPDKARVVRLASVQRTELAALYQAADLFVFPSLYEGFGLPVLEAMLARTPVLTTRCASIPEVGGPDVSYCSTPDAAGLAAGIEAALSSAPGDRAALVESACRRAQAFTWTRTATLTLDCLRRAAADSA